jgi:hypothetical protein
MHHAIERASGSTEAEWNCRPLLCSRLPASSPDHAGSSMVRPGLRRLVGVGEFHTREPDFLQPPHDVEAQLLRALLRDA